jgi:hypothetical protein
MRTIEQIDQWLAAGRITGSQRQQMAPLVLRERIPVFAELSVALYLGVLAFAGGLAWTANTHAAAWGDVAILVPATLVMAACFAYCIRKTAPYSHDRVTSPSLAFDYVLYLGCLIFGTELAYVEYRFGVLQAQWDMWLLFSAVIYLLIAYRFDNRFVLSLGIATLGGWFGVRMSRVHVIAIDTIRLSALSYAAILGAASVGLATANIKRHFLETYLHVAANVALAALLSGAFDGDAHGLWLLALLAAAIGASAAGVHFRRFAFVVYGTLYGYVGISRELLDGMHDDTARLMYVTVSAAGVVIGLVFLARRFGRDE